MAKRRPPFIQVLAPAAVLLGFAGCGGGGGKRHEGAGPEDSAEPVPAPPEDTDDTGEPTDTGDTEEAPADAEEAQ